MDYDYKKLGLALKRIREDLGWTAQQVADKSEDVFKPGQISAYENAIKRIPIHKLKYLLNIYGISRLAYFFSLIEVKVDVHDTVDISSLDSEGKITIRRLVAQLNPKDEIEHKRRPDEVSKPLKRTARQGRTA